MKNLHAERPLARHTVLALVTSLLASIGALQASAEAPIYTFQSITHGSQTLAPVAINNAGTIVGEAKDKSAFILAGSVYTEVTPQPGDVEVRFISINNSGKISAVGTAGDLYSTQHTYRWSDNVYSAADPSGTSYNGLDDENHMVGAVYDASGMAHGLFDAAQFDVPGSVATVLTAVTNTVQNKILATGTWYDSASDAHPFIRNVSAGTNTNIVLSSAVPSVYVIGINSFGTVVGWYANPGDGQYRSFVRTSDGTVMDFEVPNARQTFASGINDHGAIVGQFVDQAYNYVGFLATVENGYSYDEVVSAMQMSAGLDSFGGFSSPRRYDIDGDGYVTMHDVEVMVRKISGLEPNP